MMGNIDKTIRLVIAAVIFFVAGFVCECWWWVVGLIPLLTAVYGCPLYALMCKKGGSCPLKKVLSGKKNEKL